MPETEADPPRRPIDEPIFDAYAPPEIAKRIEKVGVAKAGMKLVPLLGLSVLAGAFIAFGAMLFTVTVTGSQAGFGLTRVAGGIAFSLGLVMVLVGGAELFTGNALIVMGWAHRKIATRALLRNWAVTYVGNFAGAAAMAVAVDWSNVLVCHAVWLCFAAGDPALAKAAGLGAEAARELGLGGFLRNQIPVALGNVVGGGGLVALTYYVIYLRGRD